METSESLSQAANLETRVSKMEKQLQEKSRGDPLTNSKMTSRKLQEQSVHRQKQNRASTNNNDAYWKERVMKKLENLEAS